MLPSQPEVRQEHSYGWLPAESWARRLLGIGWYARRGAQFVDVAQESRCRGQQRRQRHTAQDAFVVDHDRCGQTVAKMASDAEIAIVSIARQTRRLQGAHHRRNRLLG